jgi:hypothetical protein
VCIVAEMSPVTLGLGQKASQVTFDLKQELTNHLSAALEMSFYFRTRKQSCFLAYIGPRQPASAGFYLTLEINNENFIVRYGSLNGTSASSIVARLVSNGERRFISMSLRSDGVLNVTLDDNSDLISQRGVALPTAQVVYVGSLPSSATPPLTARERRQVSVDVETNFYKGSLQDLRLNNYALLLADAASLNVSVSTATSLAPTSTVNVSPGEISDNVCAYTPYSCLNNGSCIALFFDYFKYVSAFFKIFRMVF